MIPEDLYGLFNAYYKQYNRQGTRILFIQVSVVQSAQNLIEIILAGAAGMNKRRDLRSFVNRGHKIFFFFIRNPGGLFSHAGDREI